MNTNRSICYKTSYHCLCPLLPMTSTDQGKQPLPPVEESSPSQLRPPVGAPVRGPVNIALIQLLLLLQLPSVCEVTADLARSGAANGPPQSRHGMTVVFLRWCNSPLWSNKSCRVVTYSDLGKLQAALALKCRVTFSAALVTASPRSRPGWVPDVRGKYKSSSHYTLSNVITSYIVVREKI